MITGPAENPENRITASGDANMNVAMGDAAQAAYSPDLRSSIGAQLKIAEGVLPAMNITDEKQHLLDRIALQQKDRIQEHGEDRQEADRVEAQGEERQHNARREQERGEERQHIARREKELSTKEWLSAKGEKGEKSGKDWVSAKAQKYGDQSEEDLAAAKAKKYGRPVSDEDLVAAKAEKYGKILSEKELAAAKAEKYGDPDVKEGKERLATRPEAGRRYEPVEQVLARQVSEQLINDLADGKGLSEESLAMLNRAYVRASLNGGGRISPDGGANFMANLQRELQAKGIYMLVNEGKSSLGLTLTTGNGDLLGSGTFSKISWGRKTMQA